MRKLWLRLQGYRTLACMALLSSEQSLREVQSRTDKIHEVAQQSRMLREENHFKDSIKAVLRWS